MADEKPIGEEEENKPTFGEQLGLMYKRWVLDCVIFLGHAVSLDFSNRPELYQQVKDDIANKLTDIQSEYGFAPNFPDTTIRTQLMKPIFGASDGHGNRNDGSSFQTSRTPVLAAAVDFSENAQPTGFPMLRERVRSAIVPFRNQMSDLNGTSFQKTTVRMTNIFDTAADILKEPNVFAVFGISSSEKPPWPDPNWPLKSDNPQGAKLIEKITTQLPDMPYGVISRDKFVRMQRIAEKGFQSIFKILETDIEKDDAKLDDLIRELYAWGSDLGLIGGARR